MGYGGATAKRSIGRSGISAADLGESSSQLTMVAARSMVVPARTNWRPSGKKLGRSCGEDDDDHRYHQLVPARGQWTGAVVSTGELATRRCRCACAIATATATCSDLEGGARHGQHVLHKSKGRDREIPTYLPMLQCVERSWRVGPVLQLVYRSVKKCNFHHVLLRINISLSTDNLGCVLSISTGRFHTGEVKQRASLPIPLAVRHKTQVHLLGA